MMTKSAIALLVLLSGCSDADPLGNAIREFHEACKTKVEAEFTYGTWSKGLLLRCSDISLK